MTGPEELCISPSDLYHNRSRRAVIRDRARIWDDGIIPYDINENHFSECSYCIYTHPASVCTVTASTLITTWLGVTIKQ